MSRRKIDERTRAVFVAKVFKDTEWNEYRVTFSHIDTPLEIISTYHSDDLQDARATANTMLNEMAAAWWQGEDEEKAGTAGYSDETLVEFRLPRIDVKALVESTEEQIRDLEKLIKEAEGYSSLKAHLIEYRVKLATAVSRAKRVTGML